MKRAIKMIVVKHHITKHKALKRHLGICCIPDSFQFIKQPRGELSGVDKMTGGRLSRREIVRNTYILLKTRSTGQAGRLGAARTDSSWTQLAATDTRSDTSTTYWGEYRRIFIHTEL